MMMDASTSTRPADEPTPAQKAAREGNPQLLLEKLPAMLHGVMIQCADGLLEHTVFKHPSRSHPRAILHTNAQMKATIPATVDRFQQALDMLEIEILKAKAVLHRDLTKFYTAAELARQKELEEEERKAAAEREAEEERLRLQKASEEEEAASKAAAAAAAAAAVVIPPPELPPLTTDLEMVLDDQPTTAQKDSDMDQLFEDMQDVESLKVEEDASAPPTAGGDGRLSHPLEMSNIPLVAPSSSNVISLDTDKPPSDEKAKDENLAEVAATFEDPIILDSPLLPGEAGDGAEEPSAVDLFGDDPLNPVGEAAKDNGVPGAGGNMSIEDQIDMDFLFAGAANNPSDTGTAGGAADAGGAGTVDDLFGDLVDTEDKLDIMNLDIPGLGDAKDKDGEQKKGQEVVPAAQPELDIDTLMDPAAFDELLTGFGDGALGQLGNEESLFNDAFIFDP